MTPAYDFRNGPQTGVVMASALRKVSQPPAAIQGLVAPGTIDLYNRPRVKNPDGTISTVRSMSFSDEPGREILIPLVVGDAVVSPEEAIRHYRKTGEHLGIFSDPDSATAYAEALHNDYAAGKYNKR